jgi:hypothetical protein
MSISYKQAAMGLQPESGGDIRARGCGHGRPFGQTKAPTRGLIPVGALAALQHWDPIGFDRALNIKHPFLAVSSSARGFTAAEQCLLRRHGRREGAGRGFGRGHRDGPQQWRRCSRACRDSRGGKSTAYAHCLIRGSDFAKISTGTVASDPWNNRTFSPGRASP